MLCSLRKRKKIYQCLGENNFRNVDDYAIPSSSTRIVSVEIFIQHCAGDVVLLDVH